MKILNKIYQKKDYILAFLIPLIAILIVFFYLRFIIRADNAIFTSDLKAQYVALLAHFRDIILGKTPIFYSFEKGMGGNMIGTIAYYLFSPVNLLMVFFSKTNIDMAVIAIIATKLSLAGLTMYIFLKHHFINKKTMLLIMFSTCYALMAYTVSYYFNFIWFDVVYLLPLVMLGIDRIVNKKSPLLYGITLFISILTNFYIGYMLCIFSVIYFVYKMYIKYTWKNKEIILSCLINFGVTSILAGLATAFLIIPAINELAATPKLSTNIFGVMPLKINFNVFDIISRLFIGSHNYDTILNQFSPLIYTGIITIPLLLFYFLNKKINKREKIASFVVLAIFIISFSVNYISYIWHGFNAPLCFNERYSFIYSFFIIYLACESFFKSNFIKKIDYFIVAAILPILSIPIILSNYKYLNRAFVYVTIAIYFLYLVILFLYNNPKYKDKRIKIERLLVMLVITELIFNFYASFSDFNYTSIKEYNGYNDKIGGAIREIRNSDKTPFYRLEKNFLYTTMDSFIYDYSGTNIFLSTLSSNAMNFYGNNGYTKFANSVIYEQVNPIVDSILGIKYVLFRNSTNPYYKEINKFAYSKYDGLVYNSFYNDIIIAKNENALSLGYMIDKESLNFQKEFLKLNNINKIEFSNFMLKTMTNSKLNALTPLEIQAIDKYNFNIHITSADNIYILFNAIVNEEDDQIQIYVNDTLVHMYYSSSKSFIVLKNNFKIGETVKIRIKEFLKGVVYPNPAIYYFNYETYDKLINSLKSNQMEVLINKEDYIKGLVTATKDKPILFTSIPNEPGWTAYVDGKKVEIVQLYSAFNGIKLTPGKHIIEFKFYPPGLNLGLVISTISLTLSALYFWKRKKIVKTIVDIYLKHEEVINYLIVGVLTTVISLITYIILAKVFAIHYMINTFLSWVISVLFAYFANKIIVFKSKTKEIIKEAYEFIKYRILSLLMDIALMFLMVTLFHINDIFARLVIQVIVIVSNYFFSKLFIFKK